MLRYVKHSLETISGVEIFPIISFLIFFIFFLGLFYWVVTMRKDFVHEMETIPLNADNNDYPNPNEKLNS